MWDQNQTNKQNPGKQILMMKKENDQSRKIFSLQPYPPECTPSRLISEAKQHQAWLVPGYETNL
jgi:hypothetical protein